MLNFLLNKQSGSITPDGVAGNYLEYIIFFVVFLIGFAAGYGARKLIETYKNAPDSNNEKGDE